jgi:hypothetical protein
MVPQPGETADFSPEAHLQVPSQHAPELRVDVALADSGIVPDPGTLRAAAARLGAAVLLVPVAMSDGTPRHDPELLAVAFARIYTMFDSRTEEVARWR